MSKPIWDAAGSNLDLATVGYSVSPSSPQPRMTTHSVPGVDGVFVGFHGVGPRYWYGQGILSGATPTTEAAACKNIKVDILARQAKIAAEIKSYTDTSGTVYTYCVLMSFREAGPIVPYGFGAGTYLARVPVTFIIMQQDP